MSSCVMTAGRARALLRVSCCAPATGARTTAATRAATAKRERDMRTSDRGTPPRAAACDDAGLRDTGRSWVCLPYGPVVVWLRPIRQEFVSLPFSSGEIAYEVGTAVSGRIHPRREQLVQASRDGPRRAVTHRSAVHPHRSEERRVGKT